MNSKVIIGILGVLILGGVIFWLATRVSSAEEQFAIAEEMVREYYANAELTDAERPALQEEILAEYTKVFTNFPPEEKGPESYRRMAELLTDWERYDESVSRYKSFIADFPEDGDLVTVYEKVLEILAEKKKEPVKVIDWCDAFLKAFPDHEACDEWAWRKILVYRNELPDQLAPMELIGLCEDFIADYRESPLRGDAYLLIAEIYTEVDELDSALQTYQQILDDEELQGSDAEERALYEKGKLLADRMDEPEKAAEAFKEMQKKHPGGKLSGAGKGALSEAEEAARQKGASEADEREKKYMDEHYGGGTGDSMRIILQGMSEAPAEFFSEIIAQKLDVQHYEMDLEFNPEDGSFSGTVKAKIQNNGDDHESIFLQLMNGISVVSANVDGESIDTETAPGRLLVSMAKPFASGSTETFTFEVACQLGAGNPMFQIGETGVTVGGATWFPGTVTGDVFTFDGAFTVPEGYTFRTMGELVSQDDADGKSTFNWRAPRPVFGIYFGYGKWEHYSREVDGRGIHVWMREGHAFNGEAWVDRIADILAFYEERFGKYPYEKFDVLDVPLPMGIGGVGPASLMLVDGAVLEVEKPPTNLLAHEIAHQWFGNEVPVTIDNRYIPWLSEGFACYADALYLEHHKGERAYRNHLTEFGHLYLQHTIQMGVDSPIARTWQMSPVYFPVVYMKGAVVLSQLREVIGADKVADALKLYVARFAHKPSSVEDFRAICEEVSGEELFWFFNEWIQVAGYPAFSIEDVVTEALGEGFKTSLTILQSGTTFKTPLTVRFLGEDGAHEDVRITCTKEREKVTGETPWEPSTIQIDPENRVLKHPGDRNAWPESEEEEKKPTDESQEEQEEGSGKEY